MYKRPRKYEEGRDVDLFGLAVTFLMKDAKFEHLEKTHSPLQFSNIDAALAYAAGYYVPPQAHAMYVKFTRAMHRELNKGRAFPKGRMAFYWSIEPWLQDHFRSARNIRLSLSEFSRHPQVLEYKLAWLMHLSEKYRKGDLRV